jgi:NAD(P)-dependent dehydrogenase (short-subunit alcohol dehydrogenase family)
VASESVTRVADLRTAIVTGAGRGAGRAEALQLSSAGFAVVVNDLGGQLGGGGRDDTVAESVAREVRALGALLSRTAVMWATPTTSPT